jgi:hypothetical protein
MTEPATKEEKENGGLSKTCKSELNRIFIHERYKREKEIESSQMTKGTEVEEQGITIISKALRKYITKNEERKDNGWINGICDMYFQYEGEWIIADNKSSWDIFTFDANMFEEIKKDYKMQLQGYMWLWGPKKSLLINTLINTPQWLIDKEIKRLEYNVSPDAFEEEKEKLIKRMIYDDIPFIERFIMREEYANMSFPERIKERIIKCREYLNARWEAKEKLNLLTELR